MVAVLESGAFESQTLDERLTDDNVLSYELFPYASQVVTSFDELVEKSEGKAPGGIPIVHVPGNHRLHLLKTGVAVSGEPTRTVMVDITPTAETGARHRLSKALFRVISLIGEPDNLSGESHYLEVDTMSGIYREGFDPKPLTTDDIYELSGIIKAMFVDTLEIGKDRSVR